MTTFGRADSRARVVPGDSRLLRGAEWLRASVGGYSRLELDAGECRVAAWSRGRAQDSTLLLLHGFAGDKSVWLPSACRLPRDLRVLIPDLAGHGDGPLEPGLDYRIAAHARRTLSLLDALGLERVHLAGSSMGGWIAAHVAARSPQRIASLTLFNPAGIRAAQAETLDRWACEGRNPFLIADRRGFDAFWSLIMRRPPFLPGVLRRALATRFRERCHHIALMYRAYERSLDETPPFPDVQAPTSLVWGRADGLFQQAGLEALRRLMPRATLECLDGVGHLPMLEQPALAARLMARRLRGADAPKIPARISP